MKQPAQTSNAPVHATVVGAGPVGCVLALILARRGSKVAIYERRADIRRRDIPAGRSINLVLTERGLRVLERLGLREKILAITTPVLGRMMHSPQSELVYQPYGKDDSECNYSVSRGMLNEFLLDAAEAEGIEIHFEKACVGADFEAGRIEVKDARSGESTSIEAGVIFGADGAPSAIRNALVEAGLAAATVEKLGHGYKELGFPAAPGGEYAMAGHALHIWPRGDHFLMGLANLDGSFTGTVYLPRTGPNSFEELTTRDSVRQFFEQQYPDSIPLLSEGFAEEFLENPDGTLGTVRCDPFHLDARALLVGDAAHGIVPFFGQGLNCGFEDCLVLDDLFERAADEQTELSSIFEQFTALRKPNSDAIAKMALDNFDEMREKVADPDFMLQKQVEHRLEEEMSDIYRSRYAMVMYSAIPYRVAFEVGEVQEQILAELTREIDDPRDVDLALARKLIASKLLPLYESRGVDLAF
jgi:kynurenine 3-monooxygenase